MRRVVRKAGEAGQVCAQDSGQKHGDNNIAGEMDLFEANMYGLSTTSHGCQYEEPNFTADHRWHHDVQLGRHATFSECTRPLPRRGAPRELRSGKCPRDLLRRNARPRQPSDQ